MPNNSNDPIVIAIEECWNYINDYMYKALVIPATTIVVDGVQKTFKAEVVRLTHEQILSRMITNTMQMLDDFDHHLVAVTSNMMASKLCVHRQGKVYYVNGQKVKGFGPLEPEMFTNGGGLFHPYCRHNMNPWFDGDDLPTQYDSEAALAAYEKDQYRKYLKENKKIYADRVKKAKACGLEDTKQGQKDLTKRREWDSRLRSYNKSIKNGDLTPLASFDLYEETANEIEEKLVGITTGNGILIKDYSKHFVDRVIGSVEQKRNGISVDDIKKTLKNPEKIKEAVKGGSGTSQKLVGDGNEVSINPDTGNLIQTNPIRE